MREKPEITTEAKKLKNKKTNMRYMKEISRDDEKVGRDQIADILNLCVQ